MKRSVRWLLPAAFAAFTWVAVGARGEAQGPAPGAAADAPPAIEAAFQFALARAAEGKGDYRTALASFAEAVRLAPGEPYLRVEYGRLLVRLGQFARVAEERTRRFALAVEQLEAAEQRAAGDAEVLREVGLLYLELADEGPERVAAARRALEAVRAERAGDPEILVPLGQIYRAEGDLPRAVETFREAVAGAPGNGWALSLLTKAQVDLGRLHLHQGRTAQAEALFEEVLAAEPGNAEARSGQAEVLSRRGAHAEAVEVLRGIVADGARPEIRQRLVWELFMSGELEAAAGLAEQLAAEDEGAVRSLRLLLLAARGRVGEAVEGLARHLAEDAEGAAPVGAVARALAGSGRRAAAEELLAALVERLEAAGHPAAAAVRMELAELHAGRGAWSEVEEALRPLARAEAGGGDSGEAWRLLYADALFHLGRAEEALALVPAPASPGETGAAPAPVVAKRAEGLFRLGREEEARLLLESLAADGKPASLRQVAQVLQRVERFDQALPWLERAIEQEPASPEGLFLLGISQERVGRRPEAVDTLLRLIGLSPEFAPALNYLGYMWAEKGENLAAALELVQRAVALDPHNGAYVDSLGWAHFQLGQYQQAEGYLERAALLLPEDAVIFEHLGDLYLALGRRERAAEVYRRSLDLGDDNAEAVRRKLESLDGGS